MSALAPVQPGNSLATRPRVLWVARMVFSNKFRLREVELAKQLSRDIDIFALDCSEAVLAKGRMSMRSRFIRSPFQVLEEGPLTRFTTRIAFSSGPPLNRLAARFNNGRFEQAARHFGCTHVFHANPWAVSPPPHSERAYHTHFDLIDNFFDEWPANRLGNARRRFLAGAMRHCDTLSACSHLLCDVATKYTGRKAAFAPNGATRADFDRVPPAEITAIRSRFKLEGRFVVGYIGNHTMYSNGMDRIVHGWLKAALPNATLLIVGPDADKLTHTLPATPSIVTVGPVPPEQVSAYFLACDAGVHPYDATPACDVALPLNVIEFSLIGRPMLCTPLRELKRLGWPNLRFASGFSADDWAAALKDAASFASFDNAALQPMLAPYDWGRSAAVIRREMGL